MYIQPQATPKEPIPTPPENYSGSAFWQQEAASILPQEPPPADAAPPSELTSSPQAPASSSAVETPPPTSAQKAEEETTAVMGRHAEPPSRQKGGDLLSRFLPRGIRQLLGSAHGGENGSLWELLLPLAIIYLTWDSDDELLPLLLLLILI